MRSFISPHRGSSTEQGDQDADYLMMHPVYTKEYAESVKPQHKVPEKVRQVSTSPGQALHGSLNAAIGTIWMYSNMHSACPGYVVQKRDDCRGGTKMLFA